MFSIISEQSAARGQPREGRGELPLASVNSPLFVANPGRAAEDARGPRRAPVGKRRVCVARPQMQICAFFGTKTQKRGNREIPQIPPHLVEFTNNWGIPPQTVIITQMRREILNYLLTPSQGYGRGAESGGIHLKREKINNSPMIGGIW